MDEIINSTCTKPLEKIFVWNSPFKDENDRIHYRWKVTTFQEVLNWRNGALSSAIIAFSVFLVM